MGAIDSEDLQAAKNKLQQEINDVNDLLDQLNGRFRYLREEMKLITQLQELQPYDLGVVELPSKAAPPKTDGAVLRYATQALNANNSHHSTDTALEDAIETILGRQEGQTPMHIDEIIEALGETKIKIPGQGLSANVIVRMRRSPERFTRTGRGTYALAEWGLKEMPKKRRRVRRRRKK